MGGLLLMGIYILVLAVLGAVEGEEWYIPDSRMISPDQFKTHVTQDSSSYKFVKFFTPQCMWCRHLKTVVDKLKHEKTWNF